MSAPLQSPFPDTTAALVNSIYNTSMGVIGTIGGSMAPAPAPVSVGTISTPTAPNLSPAAYGRPGEPKPDLDAHGCGHATPQANIAPLETPPAPMLDIAPLVLHDITPPTFFEETAPSAPDLREFPLPVAPTEALPEVPELMALTLPEPPEFVPLVFQASLTPAPEIQRPVFAFEEPGYESALLEQLKDRFMVLITGADTGLTDAVWGFMWADALAHEQAIGKAALEECERFADWNARVPHRTLAARRTMAEQGIQSRAGSLGRFRRDAAAQSQLELMRAAVVEGLRLEAQLETFHTERMNRALEAARYSVEAAIGYHDLQVGLFEANVRAYRTQAEVYATRIRAETLKVRRYKAELEAQSLLADINAQNVAIYRERINAVVSLYELYKAQLEGARFVLEQNHLAIDSYKARISGYVEEARAAATAYESLQTRARAEGLKVERYKAEVEAFGAEVRAHGALADAEIAGQQAALSHAGLVLQGYQSAVEAWSDQIGASAEQGLINAQIAASSVRALAADLQAAAEYLRAQATQIGGDAQIKGAEVKLKLAQRQIDAATESQNAKLTTATRLAQAQIQSAITSAQIGQFHWTVADRRDHSKTTSLDRNTRNYFSRECIHIKDGVCY